VDSSELNRYFPWAFQKKCDGPIIGIDESTPDAPLITQVGGKTYHMNLDGKIVTPQIMRNPHWLLDILK